MNRARVNYPDQWVGDVGSGLKGCLRVVGADINRVSRGAIDCLDALLRSTHRHNGRIQDHTSNTVSSHWGAYDARVNVHRAGHARVEIQSKLAGNNLDYIQLIGLVNLMWREIESPFTGPR